MANAIIDTQKEQALAIKAGDFVFHKNCYTICGMKIPLYVYFAYGEKVFAKRVGSNHIKQESREGTLSKIDGNVEDFTLVKPKDVVIWLGGRLIGTVSPCKEYLDHFNLTDKDGNVSIISMNMLNEGTKQIVFDLLALLWEEVD